MTMLRWTAPVLLAGAVVLGGCQLVSGLSSLHEGSGGAGGATSSATSSGMGGATNSSSTSSSTSSGMGGATSSSTSSGMGGATSSSSSSSGSNSGSSGGCAQDCGPGTCLGGVCQAYMLATANHIVTSLAADGTYVYWSWDGGSAGPGQIDRAPVDGTAGTTTFAPMVRPSCLATDGQDLYWYDTGSGKITRESLMTGTAQPVLTPSEAPTDLHLKGTEALWNSPVDESLASAPKGGGAAPGTISTPGLQSRHFGVDASYVYWADGTTVNKRSRPLSATAVPVLVSPATQVTNVAADADPTSGYVYFTTSGALGGLYRVTKNGTTPISDARAVPANYPDALLVDGSYVYWTNYPSSKCQGIGALNAMSLSTSTAIQLATVTGCGPVAQDTTALYFAIDNVIYRQVKPVP